MTKRREPLVRWLASDTSDAPVERVWSQLASAHAPRRRLWPLGVAAVAAAAALVAFVAWPRTPVMQLGATVVADDAQREARFSDGSRVALAQESSLELVAESDAEMRVALAGGSATFEVSKRPSRHFIVEAGHVEVRVVGTRFTVRRKAFEVDVAVERGIVEVRSGEESVRLTAGQRWSTPPQTAQAAPPPAESDAAEPAPDVAPAAELAPVTPPAGAHRVHHREPARAKPPPVLAEETHETAASLFESALVARREGRFADAALALERLLRDHSEDSRAALAAFELGRLRMDSLPDLRGATEALELSMALAPRAEFAEEALLRLVKAYDARRLPAPCLHARDNYLTRFPHGVYVESVKGYCGQ